MQRVLSGQFAEGCAALYNGGYIQQWLQGAVTHGSGVIRASFSIYQHEADTALLRQRTEFFVRRSRRLAGIHAAGRICHAGRFLGTRSLAGFFKGTR